jgi:hypothetical protein
MGLVAGAAFSSKFSNLTLVFILPAIALVTVDRGTLFSGGFKGITRAAAHATAALFVCLVFVNAAYGFQGSFHRLDSHQFNSRQVSYLAGIFPGSLRVPLPFHLVRGFDLQSFDNEAMGGEKALAYWRGEWKSGTNVWFYPWLLATKLTIPLLVLAFISAFLKVSEAFVNRKPDRRWLAYLLAVSIHFIIISFLVKMYFSFRYLLAVVPFFIIFGSEAAVSVSSFLPEKLKPRTAILFAVMTSSLISCALTFPHYLSYNNAFVGGRDRQDLLDPDTSRHWGQDLPGLKKWMDRHPGEKLYLGYFGSIDPSYYGIDWELPPARPAPGIWAVSRNWLIGDCPHSFMFIWDNSMHFISRPKPYFAWLKKQKPVDRIGHSIYIYRISERPLSPAMEFDGPGVKYNSMDRQGDQ